jgi:hypothetical protein
MSELSVISRVQKLVVDPGSGITNIVDTLTYVRIKGV